MLPSSQRLSVEQFNAVMDKGRITHTPFFHMRVIPGTNTRISAVAPKKIAKKAVDRNRIRRRIYDDVAAFLPLFTSNVHAIVFAKHTLKDLDSKKAINELFVKAGLLK